MQFFNSFFSSGKIIIFVKIPPFLVNFSNFKVGSNDNEKTMNNPSQLYQAANALPVKDDHGSRNKPSKKRTATHVDTNITRKVHEPSLAQL